MVPHKDTKRAQLAVEMNDALANCLLPIMEREAVGRALPDHVVEALLDALEHHVASTIATVDDRDVRDRLTAAFNQQLLLRIAAYNEALASAETVQ